MIIAVVDNGSQNIFTMLLELFETLHKYLLFASLECLQTILLEQTFISILLEFVLKVIRQWSNPAIVNLLRTTKSVTLNSVDHWCRIKKKM